MTNTEAIKILNECRDRGFERTTYTIEEYHTARDMAIKALQEQNCDQCEVGNPCLYCEYEFKAQADGEYIPRDAVIDQLHQSINLLEAEDRIRELSSVAIPTEEPKTGHWIKGAGMWICNQCGYEKTFGIATKFCSQCGAKMGGEQE